MNLPCPTESLHAALKNGTYLSGDSYSIEPPTAPNQTWPRVIDLFTSYVKVLLYPEYNDNKKDGDKPTVYDEIWAKHQLTIMDDIQFNKASVFDIQLHFENWAESQRRRDASTMYRMCMVIDDESIKMLLDAPPAENRKSGRRVGGPVCFIKVVETFPDIDSLDGFQG